MSDTPDSGTSAREARNLGEPYVAEDDLFHLLADDVRTADQSPDHPERLDNVAGVSSSDPPRGPQNDTGSRVDAQGTVAPRRSSAGTVMTTFSRREVVHFSTCHHLARADVRRSRFLEYKTCECINFDLVESGRQLYGDFPREGSQERFLHIGPYCAFRQSDTLVKYRVCANCYESKPRG